MMKALLKMVLVCGFVSMADCTATAQTQPSACPRVEGPFDLAQVGPRAGCPLSAVIENSRSQTLADGSHVQTKSKTLVYRDSVGRVRFDNYAPTQESPSFIQIYDPVEGVQYFIQPQYAIASRSRWSGPPPSLKIGAQDQHTSAQASASPPAPGPTIERLGPQRMQGILVTGQRITWTIPAGAEGNDRALTIVRETWISAAMGITLLGKKSDPRSGDDEKRMTNLQQAEPDIALFRVPADYTIKDQ
jgi:hypothetical protein